MPINVKARVAIEQASTFGWARYVGERGRIIGMHTFGASAPLKELQKKFGFEPGNVVELAKNLLATVGGRNGLSGGPSERALLSTPGNRDISQGESSG